MTEAVIIQKPGFLYDNGLRHERVKEKVSIIIVLQWILLFIFSEKLFRRYRSSPSGVLRKKGVIMLCKKCVEFTRKLLAWSCVGKTL